MTPSTENAAKPQMTQREANWHVHLAGMRASEQAEQLGTTPQDARALLNGAVGGKLVAGMKFPPIHGGFLLMLTFLGELKEKLTALKSDSGSLMAISYCLGMPDHAWESLQLDDGGSGVITRALWRDGIVVALEGQSLPAPNGAVLALKELGAWVAEQMAAMNAGDGDAPEAEKKSPPEPAVTTAETPT